MIRHLRYFIYLFVLVNITVAASSTNGKHNSISIGVEAASYKPSILDEKPTSVFEGVPGSSLSYGVFFVSPWVGNYALRVAVLQWFQSDLYDKCDVQKIRLRPVAIDLKNRILGGTTLSPYVSYGILFIWAAEKPVGAKNFVEEKSQFGYGASVGAGLDLALISRWSLGVEFQYWYAKLSNTIGLTDDYSGPKISAKLYFMF
jgi:opacity protein-like surface antigen